MKVVYQKSRSDNRQVAPRQRACYNDLVGAVAIRVKIILIGRSTEVLRRWFLSAVWARRVRCEDICAGNEEEECS